jgi:hypothetical protein
MRLALVHLRCLLTPLGIALLGGACSSVSAGASASGAQRLRVTYLDFVAGTRLELVSESYADRVDFYSTSRRDASRKFLDDAGMSAFAEFLAEHGFERHAASGPGPARASGVVTRKLELERAGESRHWLVGTGTTSAEKQAFNECLAALVEVYSVTQSYQSVENATGRDFFDGSRGHPAEERPPARP